MELLQIIAKDTINFCIGLYGIGMVYLVGSTITDVLHGLVHLIYNKINKYRSVSSK